MISSSKTRLTVAIADLIIYKGLSFNIYQKPWFKKVLHLTMNISKGYNPPNSKLIPKDLLDIIHDQNMKKILTMINK